MDEKDKRADEVLKDAGKNFSVFVTGIGMQALVSLGELPNPLSNKKEQNPDQARYMIDTLDMIREKTKGNLNPDEEKLLDNLLYELRMKYLDLTKKENA